MKRRCERLGRLKRETEPGSDNKSLLFKRGYLFHPRKVLDYYDRVVEEEWKVEEKTFIVYTN